MHVGACALRWTHPTRRRQRELLRSFTGRILQIVERHHTGIETSPVRRIRAAADVSMKRRPRPVNRLSHKPVLHGVVSGCSRCGVPNRPRRRRGVPRNGAEGMGFADLLERRTQAFPAEGSRQNRASPPSNNREEVRCARHKISAIVRHGAARQKVRSRSLANRAVGCAKRSADAPALTAPTRLTFACTVVRPRFA